MRRDINDSSVNASFVGINRDGEGENMGGKKSCN